MNFVLILNNSIHPSNVNVKIEIYMFSNIITCCDLGISRSAKGYCMISVLETMKTFSAEDGLTEEAIVTKLRTCHYHHLYLHTSLRHNSSGVIIHFIMF